MNGDWIGRKAFEKDRILITNDKDCGEKVHREAPPHHGVIFFGWNDERAANKIDVRRRLLQNYPDRLNNQFIVVAETRVHLARMSPHL